MVQELSPARARELIPQEALAHVPGYNPQARIAALAGGEINKTFRIDTGVGRFVLRMHDPLNAILGVDHLREARLQTAAAAAGVAPAVVHIDPQQRFMIAEYIEGRVWTAADFCDVERLGQLGATLRTLHEIVPPVSADFMLAGILQEFAARIADASPAERPLLAQLMQRAQVSLRECASEARAPALFHSDLYCANIIEADGQLLLIDWEYAAVGDPLFDLACVLAYYPQATVHARVLLETSGLERQATLAMLEHATWLYVLLTFLWDRTRRLGAGIRAPTSAD